MKQRKEKICVILTGGTICSVKGTDGKNRSNAALTSPHLTEYYQKESGSPYMDEVEFDIKALKCDLLSENMTVSVWGEMLDIFKALDLDEYRGVIVLHGTDTLAYTSALLSVALAGIKIPVCMVSAQYKLGEKDANGVWHPDSGSNGYANFRAAVELIVNGIAPNVYAVYRNETGELLLHLGASLLQCPNASNDFHSRDEMRILDEANARLDGVAFETEACLYKKVGQMENDVLLLTPHTGLKYSALELDGYCAVIHGTYHSESVCIGRPKEEYRRSEDIYTLGMIREEDRPFSILYLLKECEKRGVPVFLAPCDENAYSYGTTANALKMGARAIPRITLEAAYAKALLGCALGHRGEALTRFLLAPLNGEIGKAAQK